ncbi:hypothetical protein GDO81_009851 [Engystomops pustulosus]|uniref:Uncharacterized protein n=2 Tax=Engystomops pustulosus TaxID=76066 RepID=A0AAV7BV05_ENGPU|nr:hypothetical protein GDO81_009851 [Engystomops pustulosus]KAG8576409.1 hypothetical protein GDO81_009851 [Engystomops pustulosus]
MEMSTKHVDGITNEAFYTDVNDDNRNSLREKQDEVYDDVGVGKKKTKKVSNFVR